MNDGGLDEFMAELRQEFVGDLPGHDREVSEAWAMAQDAERRMEALARLMARTHRLTGLGKTFGAPAISEHAAALEQALVTAKGGEAPMDQLEVLVAALRVAIAAQLA